MLLGALLDAGISLWDLKAQLGTLPLSGYELEASRQGRQGIFGTRFTVRSTEAPVSRGLPEVSRIIRGGGLSEKVQERSLHVFETLARVEARIHQVPVEHVHFHEVGAVDSIMDIVGTMWAVDQLGVEAVYASSLPLGSGMMKAAHGMIPIPAPATLALLKGIPVEESGIGCELVTPTGAALIRTLAKDFGSMPPMRIEAVGYGVGSRELKERPNLLRILMGEQNLGEEVETVAVLETVVDDAHPEWMGYLMERLLDSGALDVVFVPVQMKKGRPGIEVQVICQPQLRERLVDMLHMESGTLGVRFRYSERRALPRSFKEVNSPWGPLRVKQVDFGGAQVRLVPEYEACREKALEKGIPLREIYAWVNSTTT